MSCYQHSVALLQLPRRRFVELSDRARSVLGLESVDVTSLDLLTLSKDPEDTYRLFTLMAAKPGGTNFGD